MGLDVFEKSRAGQGKFAGKVLAGKYYLDRNLGEGAEESFTPPISEGTRENPLQ